MIQDAQEIAPGSTLEADVAIVGAGAAGILLALRLAAAGRRVVLLEGGGRRYEGRSQALYRGESRAAPHEIDAQYLVSSRLRFLGGTTNHWGGWCRPLEPLDFSARDWVEHSGWPLKQRALAPYYQESEQILRVAPFAEEGEVAASPTGAGSRFVPRAFHFSQPTVRFREEYEDELAASPRITCLLHANVRRIGLARGGRSFTHLLVMPRRGHRFAVGATACVVAAGGIENARLLLVSDNVQRSGIGNQNDLVGRFFMEHPHVRLGKVVLTDPPADLEPYARGHSSLTVLAPSPELQRSERVLNASLQLQRLSPPDASVSRAARAAIEVDRLRRTAWRPPVVGWIYLRGEQAPNPESRVTLLPQRDRLGMRRVRLDWQLGALDIAGHLRTLRALGAELGASALGRVRIDLDAGGRNVGIFGGFHHLGTTRMARRPREGVVDRDCKVFGVDNLFIAGSSVFPTSGFANPTFTIVALTLRLADHLLRWLDGARPD